MGIELRPSLKNPVGSADFVPALAPRPTVPVGVPAVVVMKKAAGNLFHIGQNKYVFQGFGTLAEACTICGSVGLVMPRSVEEHRALKAFISTAIGEGKMSLTWPQDTVWLGGRWSKTTGHWEDQDGNGISSKTLASLQPSAAG